MKGNTWTRRLSIPLFLAVLAAGLTLPASGEARKPPAYKTYKKGQSVKKAFRSVTRQYRGLKRTYKTKKLLHKTSKHRGGTALNFSLLPVSAGYVGFAGHQTIKNIQFMSDAIARGSTPEIIGGALMTTLVAGFAAGNIWFGKANIDSARGRMAATRKLKSYARRDTLKALLDSPQLQRQVNRGKLLPASDLKAMRNLVKAIPAPPSSYKPSSS